jgi:hypothetical protein
VTKDQLQHHLISAQQVDLGSVQQADRDSVQQAQAAQAAKADHAKDALFSVAKYAVFVQKRTWLLTIKNPVRSAFLLQSAAKLFRAEFQETVLPTSDTLLKPSSGPETLLYCRLLPTTQ